MIAPVHTREPQALSTLRSILLWTLVFGAAGMMGELLLIGHAESTAQFVPLVLLATGVSCGQRVLLISPTPGRLRLMQLLMILFLGAGILGVGLHYQGNNEFELEMYPSLAGVELLSKTLTGATPVLAPGSMSLLGVIGLASDVPPSAPARSRAGDSAGSKEQDPAYEPRRHTHEPTALDRRAWNRPGECHCRACTGREVGHGRRCQHDRRSRPGQAPRHDARDCEERRSPNGRFSR